jgi:hypothetical protein
MTVASGRWLTKSKALVLVALFSAVAFGGVLGYLALSNDSFPSRESPFQNYASLASATFNGTEYSFRLNWLSTNYTPKFAQISSDETDAANSPVCDIGQNVSGPGGTLFLPFAINTPSSSLGHVDLWLDVEAVNGTQFSIVYHANPVSAVQGDIEPSDITCNQPSSPM